MFETLRDKIFGRTFSKQTAKNRLQMVLVQDRSGLTQTEMDNFRKELLEVIAKYFQLEKATLDIEWHRTDAATALVINSPVVGKRAALPKGAALATT